MDSFLSQDYKDKEMIVVDDSSNDGSYDVLQSYAKKYDNIKIFRNSARFFCGGSYNVAILNASGDICGVLDGDDVLSQSDAISLIVKQYEKYANLAYIYTQFFWCNENLQNCHKGFSDLPIKNCSLAETFLKGKHAFSHWRTFRTSCRDKRRLFVPGMKYGVDKQLGFYLEEIGEGGFYNKCLYKYRFHNNNMTHYAVKYQKNDTQIQAREIINRRNRNGIKPFPIRKIS